jgi:hypothetical protein
VTSPSARGRWPSGPRLDTLNVAPTPYDTDRFAEATRVDRVSDAAGATGVVEQMLADPRAEPDAWENPTLERYLDALAACLGDFQQPAQPSWRLLAELLVKATGYE